jgi:hypothetical protein
VAGSSFVLTFDLPYTELPFCWNFMGDGSILCPNEASLGGPAEQG